MEPQLFQGGYTVGTTQNVQFRGGTGADFTANVTVAFTGGITEPGAGYYDTTYVDIPVQYVNVASGAITVLGTITGGSGYVDGSYTNIGLTSGTGSNATADFTISGGSVTQVVINARGSGYALSDSLGVSTSMLVDHFIRFFNNFSSRFWLSRRNI